MMSVGVDMTSYNLMMCGCRKVRMYSNSRRTRVLVFSRWMTALEMYFMATLWPVIVCVATDLQSMSQGNRHFLWFAYF